MRKFKLKKSWCSGLRRHDRRPKIQTLLRGLSGGALRGGFFYKGGSLSAAPDLGVSGMGGYKDPKFHPLKGCGKGPEPSSF